jgi:hypothetical protein
MRFLGSRPPPPSWPTSHPTRRADVGDAGRRHAPGGSPSSLALQDRKSFRERYLKPALAEGLIEMTHPANPTAACRSTA